MKIQILFENDDILSVYKPDNITSIPGNEKGKETLRELVEKQCGNKIFVVHRLDKEVSGVMLFAKNAAAHKCLNDQFAAHTICKTYIALVNGVMVQSNGTINKPIHQFGSGRMGVDELRGKPSVTDYEIIEKFENYTLVKAFPKTGRKHQIRVHMYAIDHPIVGDTKYGNLASQNNWPRMMLHALSITFVLPTSGDEKTIEAPVPESFTNVVNTLLKSNN